MTLVLGLALVLAVVVFVLFDGFEGELDFAVEGGKVGFELFELVFLFPRFFDYFLKDEDVPRNLLRFLLDKETFETYMEWLPEQMQKVVGALDKEDKKPQNYLNGNGCTIFRIFACC